MVDKDCNQNVGYFWELQVNIGYISSSNVTISGRVGSTGDPVEEDGGIPPHQEEGDPGPGMAGGQEKPGLPHLAPHLAEQLSPSAVPGCSSQFPGSTPSGVASSPSFPER